MEKQLRRFLWLSIAAGMFLLFLNFLLNGTMAIMTDHAASGIAEFISGTWLTPQNCTYSQGYWKEHPDAWPVEGITIGDLILFKDDAIILLKSPPKGDATYILVHQLITTELNIFNGVDSSVVLETIQEAYSWLHDNPLASNPGKPNRKEGIDLAAILDLFNNGLLGPGHCSGEEVTISLLPMEITVHPESLEPLGDAPSTPEDSFGGGNVSREVVLPAVTPTPTESASLLLTATPMESSPQLPTATYTERTHPILTLTPSETPRPTPTLAPTMSHQLTSTVDPFLDMASTPTIAPTSYPSPTGCTNSLEYWLGHPDVWPLDEFELGDLTLNQASALEVLAYGVQVDASLILGQQYIAALLNIASPADPTEVTEVLENALLWFGEHPLGSSPKNSDRKIGIELAEALEEYNFGLVGPGICEQVLSIATPTFTSTLFPTQTPSGNVTPTLALTQLPTIMPTLFFTPTPQLPTPELTEETGP